MIEAHRYRLAMEDVKRRLLMIEDLGDKTVTLGDVDLDRDAAFLQFRKVLEFIAFSSLIAHKELYSQAYANFHDRWRACKLLEDIEKLNPNYYPQPIDSVEVPGEARKHLTPRKDGFLTKGDFVTLYDKTSEFIHVWNPYTKKVPKIDLVYSAREWLNRIWALLKIHVAHLPDDRLWIVVIPKERGGAVQVATAELVVGDASVEQKH